MHRFSSGTNSTQKLALEHSGERKTYEKAPSHMVNPKRRKNVLDGKKNVLDVFRFDFFWTRGAVGPPSKVAIPTIVEYWEIPMCQKLSHEGPFTLECRNIYNIHIWLLS